MSDLLRRHVAAFNDRDVEALLAGFTDDAGWITGTTVARGRAGLRELFESAVTRLLPTLTIDTVVADGDVVAAELTERLTHEGEDRTFAIAAFYRLRDGRIASAKIYREGSAEL
ncbi:nuclear transport factor 2 family protein [Amycolatopsis sp. FDAARGOS 1241]|uniref:nuclear transport factor 2 family protein n=1 Tax=Amycolatopsis sp. FDAARGOS 1241 TaxID=2778070 RepID=UPI001951003B|nr:nuclear transport factor 2 family protein [Amycolatopsis sp. FDAARGOS 1241]QRP44576.1 nuclear transport factor 2 family protein [Amycolatopsis sp. FDAARGOS 1241]